jgi:hypothetical protein
MLQVFAALDDPIASANDYDNMNSLFGALEQDFGFIHYAQHSDHQISAIDFECLVGLIRWLMDEFEQYRQQEPLTKNLVAHLATTAFLDQDRLFWRELALQRGRCLGFFTALGRVLEGSRCSFNTRGARAPIWELEACGRFEAADAARDFVAIDELWKSLESALIPNFLLRQSALCLCYHDFPRLIAASAMVMQTSVASWVIDALPSTAKLCLAFLSESPWVRFAAIYCTVQSRRQRRFRPSAHRLLVLALGRLAQDPEMWAQAMAVFNKYPVRYPALQPALGEALATAPLSTCDAYVDAIDIGRGASGRDEIASCLRTFRTHATAEKREALFFRIFRRWAGVMVKVDEDRHHHEPFSTELDYGVVAYLVDFSDNDGIIKGLESICAEIWGLESAWYRSESDCITAFNMLLSRLQPYYQALKVHEVGGDLLPQKIRVPIGIAQDRYCHLMFRCSYA